MTFSTDPRGLLAEPGAALADAKIVGAPISSTVSAHVGPARPAVSPVGCAACSLVALSQQIGSLARRKQICHDSPA
eukprot:152046-Alexandrium_andersonii.AAC.1